MKTPFTWRRTLLGLAAASVIGHCSAFSFGAEDSVVIAPPALDETTQAHSETAVFAGGLFLGRPRGVPTCERREESGFRLCRWRGQHRSI